MSRDAAGMDTHPTSRDAVAVDRLTKTYGHRAAVNAVSFSIPSGSVAGLVGPNGAGKTTLMAMLLGLVRPSGGTATVLGHDLARRGAYLPRVGALIESPAFHPAASGRANLRAQAILAGHRGDADHIDGLLSLVGLDGRGEDRVGSYSLGMKQRLGIAAALIGDPELVILDEPTNGLDPMGMQEVRALIAVIARQGRTVLVSSHLLAELEQICDWLVVLDHGGLAHVGAPATLGLRRTVLRAEPADRRDRDALEAVARRLGLDPGPGVADDELRMLLPEDADRRAVAADLNTAAHEAGITLSSLVADEPDLEERYLEVLSATPTPITTGGPR